MYFNFFRLAILFDSLDFFLKDNLFREKFFRFGIVRKKVIGKFIFWFMFKCILFIFSLYGVKRLFLSLRLDWRSLSVVVMVSLWVLYIYSDSCWIRLCGLVIGVFSYLMGDWFWFLISWRIDFVSSVGLFWLGRFLYWAVNRLFNVVNCWIVVNRKCLI